MTTNGNDGDVVDRDHVRRGSALPQAQRNRMRARLFGAFKRRPTLNKEASKA